jgi:NADH-quinone oxidoreductase subunit C
MEEKKVLDNIKKKFSGKIKEASVEFGDEVVSLRGESLLEVVKFLMKEPYAFSMLLDLTCVDYIGQRDRFQMVYHLFSLSNNHRLRIKVSLPEKDPAVDSLTPLFKNANWLEREVFDMFGIQFNGHPDLRRIFMYDGFEGYPLRKDYPLRKRQPRIRLRK